MTFISDVEVYVLKVSSEKMAENRECIIDSAARAFRENGLSGVSIADLMDQAGMTHGGFYNHFASKDELISLAIGRAFDQMLYRWQRYAELNPHHALRTIVEGYLSERHLRHPESGCVIAALGTETAKQSASVRAAMSVGIERLLGFLEQQVDGRTSTLRRNKAIAVLSQIAGAMMLARAQGNIGLAQEVLEVSSRPFIGLPNRKRKS